jgi:hypothetical protein
MGDLLPGFALRFHPGLSHFAPSARGSFGAVSELAEGADKTQGPEFSCGTPVILCEWEESRETSSKKNRPPSLTHTALLKPYASSNSRTGLPSLNLTVRPIGV